MKCKVIVVGLVSTIVALSGAYRASVCCASGEITVNLPGGASMEMVWIPPGTFTMGTTEEQKQWMVTQGLWNDFWMERELPGHQVTISWCFYLGKYELTQEQWESVMGTRPWSGQGYVQENPSHPASHISWNDVQTLIQKLNEAEGSEVYRLPTEAEWEYACRAGTTTLWSFGDDESQFGDYAWYQENAWNVDEKYPHAVGTKLANPWGLYDMHGNVWEWVQDWYGPYRSGPQTDPTGPSSGEEHVVRGSSFDHVALFARSALRGNVSGRRSAIFGARLVRTQVDTHVSPTTWGEIKSLFKSLFK